MVKQSMAKIMEKQHFKWALILGGSSGLGLATAKKLAKHGFHLIVVHRSRRAELEEIEFQFQEIRALGVQLISFNADALQIDKRNEILNGIKNHLVGEDKIAVLVHSIAKGSLKPMHAENGTTLNSADFKITYEAMALSLYDWTNALVKANLLANDTRIISFTSEGNTKALPGYAAVSVAKVALEAITRSMAVEFAKIGITANCIQAGVTETKALKMIPGYEKIVKNALKRNPHKRLTTPEDVANAVYVLTTPEAKWITGTVIKVDGGESLL